MSDNRLRARLIKRLLDDGLAEEEFGYGHATADDVADAVLDVLDTAEEEVSDPAARREIEARALQDAADDMPGPSKSSTEYWDGEAVRYVGWEESPRDKTPKSWLLRRAEQIRAGQ